MWRAYSRRWHMSSTVVLNLSASESQVSSEPNTKQARSRAPTFRHAQPKYTAMIKDDIGTMATLPWCWSAMSLLNAKADGAQA